MRTFRAILGFLALLFVGAHLVRHVYVRFIESRESVLDQFDPTKQQISAAKSLNELVELFRAAHAKADEARGKDGADAPMFGRHYSSNSEKEPYKTEYELSEAIRRLEQQSRDLRELHFFWWSGFIAVLFGVRAHRRDRQWFGLSILAFGYLEMIWATSPSLWGGGSSVEFDRLLTFKVAYSFFGLVMLLIGWRLADAVPKVTATHS